MITVHVVKSWPSSFQKVWDGKKRAEFRVNDRAYKEADILVMQEWDRDTEQYTGRELVAIITCVNKETVFAIPEGWAMLSIEPLKLIEP